MPLVGSVTFKYKSVPKLFANPIGKIHGGAMVTWVDALTSIAVYVFDQKHRAYSVTISMAIDCVRVGNLGEDIYIKADVLKVGKSLAFTECQILNSNQHLIASATHKKAFVNKDAKM